ncbi:MFS-type transporter SLC18B1-like [Lingula anatina]|uniref:MFS-type transporter SLC18B1-like n=1 Tax=Lingula anatina TaxID=7574 RepID=A0A1S3H3F0_LINAN|nr:MFS-type transporter SLC18B1-like [Lingula anatina]|eukprot:XP_013380477.1 MFS-type transporter SLC18B1-like [Lingula anatina]
MERRCKEIHDEKEGRDEEIEDEKEGRGETVKKHTGEELLKLSSRQKSSLMNGALANIALSACYSVMQPFLRDQAIKKDVSLTGAGAIFGCYEVAMFCCSLIIGSQGFLEMFAGLGHVLGPLVGGGLYQVAGFGLPFFVTGPMSIVIAAVAFFTLPSDKEEEEMPSDYGQLIKLAKIPAIPLEHLAVWVGFVGLSALSPTLGGHLQNVDASVQGNHIMIGLAFALCGIFYTFSVPLFGCITDKCNHRKVIIVLGLIVTALSFTLIGPWVPLTDLFPNDKGATWAVFLGNCLCGIGTACINVAVMADCVNEAVSHGLPDSIITYGNLSAIFDTSMGLG